MLTIRMQRTGRKGHAMFRVVVQDSRVTPTSGKIVAMLGSYDPHAKTTALDKEKAATFLKNGAQPSDRVASLLKKEGVKLPKWVSVDTKKAGKLKNQDKLRKNRSSSAEATEDRPTEPKAEQAPVEESAPEEPAKPEAEVASTEEAAAEPVKEAVNSEASAEESAPQADPKK